MTTKTMTASAPEKKISPAVNGPKIKTALPGPNALRVLAGDQKYISPSYTRYQKKQSRDHRDAGRAFHKDESTAVSREK